ncbi:Lactococcin-G-processing and transport ATP-binding protein LagD [Oligella urethralis]|uniref:Lactococcin-G-processing and transport ATP-binding protein LagD n=2 Tax=Oligella urethralis TaxID=90245 RepID=A0A2X1WM13_9BURK|nr:Lactococcin-G-processing and transport ATP-binding protein LagD [Oligella urethralis]
MRFDDPGIGHIKIDNHSLRDISTTSIAKLIAYVPQEPIISTGSLLSNLTYGLVNVDNKAVHEVIEALDLTQLIERDSLGLEQSVGQQGSALSGGEAQRICLARAILKNTPILLLDEPTSAVDTTTEKKIIDYLINRECTIIYVTHNNGELWRPTQTVTLDKPKNEIKTSKQIN